MFAGSKGDAPYRLQPVIARESQKLEGERALHAALASTLRDAILEQTGLDLCLPRATFDTPLRRRDTALLIVDNVAGRTPTGDERGHQTELQQAVVGQWLLGKPNPRWADFARDDDGRLRARSISPCVDPLIEVWSEAVNRGPSALFRTPDGKAESAITCKPLDDAIRYAIAHHLDMGRIERALSKTYDRMAGHLPGKASSTLSDKEKPLLARLMAPLRALRQALIDSSRHPGLPLEMLMADAGDCLHAIDKKEFRQA
ncbi:hypothetical protein ABE85_08145 [Mitsuaria sp. 7]|nr:hypothetical protein ABE85_08145 [Mitsuaria sp. 7]